MGRHLGRLLIVALASVLLAACATSSSSGVPASGVPASGPMATRPASAPGVVATATPATSASRLLGGRPMIPCLVQGEVPVKAEVAGLCGTLSVPEDRSDSGGRRIDLRVAVVPALAANPRPDPLFAIAGGPGDAGTQFFAWLPGLFAGIHATRDIVLVDQRGTGGSNALTLPSAPDTSGMSAVQAEASLAAWMHDALAALDADPRFYTSTVAANDLDDVRAALGYDTIDLYGASYGGTLAQYYLRQHPDHVRAAVLDGSTPLDVPVLERMAASSQHALDLLLARCADDAACHQAFPDLAGEWSTLASRLAAGIATNVVNPETGEHAVADLLTVGPSLHHALLTESGAAPIPLSIHLAFGGDWTRSGELVPPVSTGFDTLLMADMILCTEAWARLDPAEVARAGAGSYALPAEVAKAMRMATLCRQLPRGVAPADDARAVRTTLPVLWITGDGDPQDPPANLTGVSTQEPNARVVVMPAQEHVVGHLGCAPAVIAAFIDTGTAQGLDTSCVAQGAPAPSFLLP